MTSPRRKRIKLDKYKRRRPEQYTRMLIRMFDANFKRSVGTLSYHWTEPFNVLSHVVICFPKDEPKVITEPIAFR